MSEKVVRAIAYGAVAVLAVVAIMLTRPLPPGAERPIAAVLSAERVEDLWRERHDTVRLGESLMGVLARGGVSELIAREAINAAKTLDPRRIRVGLPIRIRTAQDDTVASEIIFQLAIDRLLHLKRDTLGWTAQEERLPWRTDTVVVTGVIRTNLYDAMEIGARDAFSEYGRRDLTWTLADIFEYRVDMSRDLRVGDSFRVLAERKILSLGSIGVGAVKMEKVVAASMTLSGVTTEAVRFRSAKVGGDFFDANGKSMRASFLRAPLQFRRVSSGFGMRRHPILGTMRQHQGLDYAAAAGTAVRAVGDGIVIRAGWASTYGNLVEIRHPNGFITRYGHMRDFADGVHRGARVTIAQTIGYVGSTGLSTAPHLHFEVLKHGAHQNPRTALANQSSDPIPLNERVAFAEARSRVIALMESPAYLASAETSLPGRGSQ